MGCGQPGDTTCWDLATLRVPLVSSRISSKFLETFAKAAIASSRDDSVLIDAARSGIISPIIIRGSSISIAFKVKATAS